MWVDMKKMNYVGCMRFMPKEEKATLTDPRFSTGELKVVTYLEGRTDHTDEDPIKDLSE